MKDCERFSAMLPTRAEGSLGTEDTLALDEHLASCPSCAALLEDLRQLEAVCAGIRSTAAGDSEITRLKEAVMTTLPVATPARRHNFMLRMFLKRRWLTTGAIAAAAAVILVFFIWPGMRGSSSITWADVMKSVESAPWVHYVTRDASGDVVYEEWGTPDNREAYVKVDKGRFRHGRFTDYMRGKQWSMDGTLTDDPDARRTISPGRIEGSSTVFDVTYAYKDRGILTWGGQARTERVYVDNATARPTRIESECYFNLNGENETTHVVTTIEYPAAGPSELVAVGVPHGSLAQQPAQPPADAQAVIAEYQRHRDAFAAACTEYTALYYGDTGYSYLLRDRGNAWRVEGYLVAHPSKDAIPAGGAPADSVEICDGSQSRRWESDGQSEVIRGNLRELRMSNGLFECGAVNFSWPTISRTQLIHSDAPALAGLIGLEYRSTSGEITRQRFWINPQRDYILARWDSDDFKGGKWVPSHRNEVVDYARLSTGQYYASAKRIYGEMYAFEVTYAITEHPSFDKDAFDPDIYPWATAEITVTNAQGASANDLGVCRLAAGWYPKVRKNGTTITVTNLPHTGPTSMLVFDKKHGLVKVVTVTPTDGRAKLDVALDPGIEFSGVVKDDSGAPVADVNVIPCILGDIEGVRRSITSIEFVRTDASGRYALRLIAPGVQFGIQTQLSDFQRGQALVEIDPATRTAKVPDIVIAKALHIGGCVTDASTGLPIEGLTVRVGINHSASYAGSHTWDAYGVTSNDWEIKTDKDGRWSCGADSGYVYKARIFDMRYKPAALDNIQPGTMNVDFQPVPDPVVPDSPK